MMLTWLPSIFLLYTLVRLGKLSIGKWAFPILFIVLLIPLAVSMYLDKAWIYYVSQLILLILFDLFYDQEPFPIQGVRLFILGILLLLIILILPLPLVMPASAGITLLLIWHWTGSRSIVRGLSILLIFALYTEVEPLGLNTLLSILSFFTMDQLLYKAQQSFDITTKAFQQELMEQQYQEIKEVYLQMRGWRHDYHNHMQSMKAYLAQGKYIELSSYLNELEEDLNSVDTLIKSGNNMVDAILNAKFSLAKSKSIGLDVTVKPLAKLPFSDVHLCVILGNLMDNAIEACEKIPEEQRFIRLYLDTKGEQLYLSLQNSAKELLDFEEKSYISKKRGNHGLGMMRVALIIDKYHGYLNLQNQPGVFACEVSMPIAHE